MILSFVDFVVRAIDVFFLSNVLKLYARFFFQNLSNAVVGVTVLCLRDFGILSLAESGAA